MFSEDEELTMKLSKVSNFNMKLVDDVVGSGEGSDVSLDLPDSFEDEGEPLPEVTDQWKKMWREAKREAVKSEYAFRLNYNYYNAPDSMYKYDSSRDSMNN